jgi:cellobiose epimerase
MVIKNHYNIKLLVLLSFICIVSTIHKASLLNKTKNNPESNRDTILLEMQKTLDKMFMMWYPLSIDTVYGGFYSDINYKWELDGIQNKMLVTQSRHVWSASNAFIYYNGKNKLLKIVAKHGFNFLKDVMWDKEFGGFYELVNRNGEPLKDDGKILKTAYGNAFSIYALAGYYRAFGDTSALNLAIKAFYWMEKHSYDPRYSGYFQFLAQNGTPFIEGQGGIPPKDQNSSIHILECFTELYKVWNSPLLKERLTSLLHVIRDIFVTEKGYLIQFFMHDLKPVSFRDYDTNTIIKNYYLDHVSFGHDVETAYLILEASGALGIENDTVTLKIAKNMDDHTILNGWDNETGGIYDGGYYFNGKDKISIVKDTKEWWAQAEAFNSFLLMSELLPKDKMNYYRMFCKQWAYCKKYVIDNKYGDWYWGGIDKQSSNIESPKSTIWKCNYHTSRALINCIKRLDAKSR